MSVGYLTYRPGDMIPVNNELLNKFEIYRDNRSQAQTIRDILCAALGVHLSKIDLSYGHVQKISTRIEMALEKERSKRGISKRETVRQLVSEQLESREWNPELSLLYPSRSDRSGISTLFYIGLDLYWILILAALTVFMLSHR